MFDGKLGELRGHEAHIQLTVCLQRSMHLKIEEHKQDILQTSKLLEKHNQEIISLKASLNEQIDRSLRSTLVFKGIPKEKNENSWDDAKNTLTKYLSATFKPITMMQFT